MPGFYQRPASIEDIVNQTVVRILDQFAVHLDSPGRWGEAYTLGMAGRLPAEDSDEY
jgi:3-polyprenyl-4-hydroxybenzoate decarboxylase